MFAKVAAVLCVSAILVQSISGQCTGFANNQAWLGHGNNLAGVNGCGAGLGGALATGVAAASGGGFPVSTNSPIAPIGISVVSENAIEGALAVNGQLPVLAAVAVEGQLPSSGAAGVTYSCGDNNVGIASQSLSAAGVGNANAAGLAGVNSGLAGYGGVGLANAGIGGLSLAGTPCGRGPIY